MHPCTVGAGGAGSSTAVCCASLKNLPASGKRPVKAPPKNLQEGQDGKVSPYQSESEMTAEKEEGNLPLSVSRCEETTHALIGRRFVA